MTDTAVSPATPSDSFWRVLSGKVPVLAVLVFLGIGAGGTVLLDRSGRDRVGDLSDRVERAEKKLDDVEGLVNANDVTDRLAALESFRAEASAAASDRDRLMERIQLTSENQTLWIRWVGVGIQKLGRKSGVDIGELPPGLKAEATNVEISQRLRERNRVVSPR